MRRHSVNTITRAITGSFIAIAAQIFGTFQAPAAAGDRAVAHRYLAVVVCIRVREITYAGIDNAVQRNRALRKRRLSRDGDECAGNGASDFVHQCLRMFSF